MSTPSKSLASNILTMASVATGVTSYGTAVDVATVFSALLLIKLGRTATTALTASPNFMIEGSYQGSGDTGWFPMWETYLTSNPALDLVAAESEAVSGTVAAAATTVALASTTNLVIGEFVCASNGASSEVRRIKSVTANTNIGVDAIAGAWTGLTLYDNAQMIIRRLDLNHIKRVRGFVDTTGVGTAVLVEMLMNTLDSVG